MVNRGTSTNMAINKKGIFFTLATIILLSIFVISHTVRSGFQERETLTQRVTSMNNFIFSLEKDIARQIYISGFRAILSVENYITTNGTFIDNAALALTEALINGTIKNQTAALMTDYRLADWNARITNLSDKISLITNYTIEEVTITQDKPWEVRIDAKIRLRIQDKGNLAHWDTQKLITTRVVIEGFEDPLYLIHSNGLVVNKIQRTPYTGFVSGSDVTNLTNHLSKSYYIASPTGPSFLNRLEGKTNPNAYGIESLINLANFTQQGVGIQDKSVVDYIYFSSANPTAYKIQGMQSWFKLDDPHLDTYGVRHLVTS